MYEIERRETQVIIRKGSHAVFMASLESWIVYRSGAELQVSQVRDLPNDKLLLALANAIEIKDSHS